MFRVAAVLVGLFAASLGEALTPEVAPGVSVEPASDWVEAEVDFIPPPSNPYAEGGVVYHQILEHFRPEDEAFFSRLVMEFQSQQGLEDSSTLVWNIDPEFERLSLHWIRVFRDGEWIDLLPDVEIDVVDARTDMQSWFYDDSKDVMIILKKIQVGDVLDYGFTRWGSNPVVEDYFSGSASLGYAVPVGQIEVRVDWPNENQKLRFRTYPSEVAPEVTEGEERSVYSWKIEDASAIILDANTPSTIDVFPWVQFSDWPSWAAVAQWASDLYEISGELPPVLREKVDEILATNENPAERATKVLEYVQDSIRYVSIPVGPHSYQPYPVTHIMDRQYGDCKDKSSLVVLMLREIGFDADFVLVNSEEGQTLDRRLPSQAAFDHVIVRAIIDDQEVWMDPTDSEEGGVLPDRYMENFGFGLVVSRATERLTGDVGPQASDKASSSLTEDFSFTGFGEPVDLVVNTRVTGRDADNFRWELAANGLGGLERTYANYYATIYDQVPDTSPIKISDDRRENVIDIEERYLFPPLFVKRAGEESAVVSFSAEIIRDQLPYPSDRIRTTPLSLPRPVRQTQTINIHLPDDSVFDSEDFELESKWFRYEFSVRQEGRRLSIHHEFEILAGLVSLEKLSEFEESLDEVDRYLDYSIEVNWDQVEGNSTGGLVNQLLNSFSHPIDNPNAPGDEEGLERSGIENESTRQGVAVPWVVMIAASSFVVGILFARLFLDRRR